MHAAIAQHRVALAQYLVTLTNGEGTTHPSTCTAPSASPSSGVVSLLLAISGACWADDATSNPSEGSLELPTITNTTSIARVSRQRIMQYNYTGYLRSSPSPQRQQTARLQPTRRLRLSAAHVSVRSPAMQRWPPQPTAQHRHSRQPPAASSQSSYPARPHPRCPQIFSV